MAAAETLVRTIRILIVDDHEVMRGGLRSLLESRPEWEVCGEAADGLEAVEKAKQLKPDVVILDINMPALNGLDAARLIRKQVPQPEILILSRYEASEMRSEALQAGAREYVAKSQNLARDLLVAIDEVARLRSTSPRTRILSSETSPDGVSRPEVEPGANFGSSNPITRDPRA